MDQIFGSVNNHGGYNGLQHRAEGIPEQSTAITVSADSADSLLAAAPSSWTKIISRTKSLRESLVDGYEIAELKKSFGEAQTNAVLKSFMTGNEKRVDHTKYGILDYQKMDGKTNYLTKKRLKVCGYEAYGLELEAKRTYFSTRAEAESYAKKLNVGANPTVREEGSAEIVIDKDANVISTTGTVVKRELDPATKQRLKEQDNQYKTIMQVLSFFGGNSLGLSTTKLVGPTFQVPGYQVNWIPPQSKIEILDNKQVRISVPQRFAVNTRYHKAFAIKNYDQYRYLVAQGLDAINSGMCGRDVINQLKIWDGLYGLSVLNAEGDAVTAKLDKLPIDLNSFVKQEKQFCSDADEPKCMQDLTQHRIISFWWDDA